MPLPLLLPPPPTPLPSSLFLCQHFLLVPVLLVHFFVALKFLSHMTDSFHRPAPLSEDLVG